MTTPSRVRIKNQLALAIHLRMEPEGDYVKLLPGELCEVSAPPGEPCEFEIVFEAADVVVVYTDAAKTVVMNGARLI